MDFNKLLEEIDYLKEKAHNAIICKLLKCTHIHASVIYGLLRKVPVSEMEIYLEIYKESLDKKQG